MDSYDVRKAFERIELELIRSMARNVGRHLKEEEKEGFNWNQWQAEQIKSLRRFQNHNKKEYGPHFKKINDSIADMIRSNANDAAVAEHMRFLLNDLERGNLEPEGDFFGINKPKLDALIKATTEDMERAEYAMLRKVDDEYRKTIFDAQVYANTGAGTLKQAVDMATRDFLQKGINCVEYADGKKVNIASYAEMAIRTANTRAVNIAEGEVRKDRKWHLVRISKYGQCSEICLPWQGRIYVDDVYSGGTAEESKEKGYPLLSEAIDGGLFHPNCKHRSTTYFPELEEDDETEEFENHPLQKDFNINHRDLQKQKRLEAGSLDETNKKKAKAKRVKAEKKEKMLVRTIDQSGLSANDTKTFDGVKNQVIKRGRLTRVDDETKMKVLKAYEKTIVNKDVEHVIVITKAGEVYEVVGGARRVHPQLIGDEKLDGAFVTHNHPKDETEYTLSRDDVDFFTDYNLSKLRGVDYVYEYELDREFEGSNVDADAEDWMNENNENGVHAQTCNNCDDKQLRYRRIKK